MYYISICILLLALVGCEIVYSQTSAIPHAEVTALYFTGAATNGEIFGPFGDGTSYWNIAQWTSPGPINNSSALIRGLGPCNDPGTTWYMANVNTRVCVSEGENLVELAQNSVGLPCGPSYEYDLFLSANSGYGGMNVNWDMVPPLGQLSYVNMSFDIQLLFINVESHCGTFPECSSEPDYAYSTAAVVLGDGKDTLFYQIILFDSRGMNAPWNCSAVRSACDPWTGWFAVTNPYGVNEAMANYESACLDDLQPHTFNYNLLPHLEKLIGGGVIPNANWQNWTLGGGYIGTGGNGLFQSTLQVSNFSIIYG